MHGRSLHLGSFSKETTLDPDVVTLSAHTCNTLSSLLMYHLQQIFYHSLSTKKFTRPCTYKQDVVAHFDPIHFFPSASLFD